jgi:UDP-N-acetylmuramoyl-tripeptide--D-alanyl-D-alanine ligase
VIDDSYNANPSSMEAAIDVLESMEGSRWMVLGAMGELGTFSHEAHRDLGRYARSHGVSRLFCFGLDSQLAVKEFGDGAEWFSDIDSLLNKLCSELTRDISLLVKGSRSNRLERVVNALCGDAAEGVH